MSTAAPEQAAGAPAAGACAWAAADSSTAARACILLCATRMHSAVRDVQMHSACTCSGRQRGRPDPVRRLRAALWTPRRRRRPHGRDHPRRLLLPCGDHDIRVAVRTRDAALQHAAPCVCIVLPAELLVRMPTTSCNTLPSCAACRRIRARSILFCYSRDRAVPLSWLWVKVRAACCRRVHVCMPRCLRHHAP